MSTQLSPGVKVKEIDLSIMVPNLGNSVAVFAGDFIKGPSDKYVQITNVEQLISVFGKPNATNYNDWYQCFNFLQYSSQLHISRAVKSEDTIDITKAKLAVVDVEASGEVNKFFIEAPLDPEYQDRGTKFGIVKNTTGAIVSYAVMIDYNEIDSDDDGVIDKWEIVLDQSIYVEDGFFVYQAHKSHLNSIVDIPVEPISNAVEHKIDDLKEYQYASYVRLVPNDEEYELMEDTLEMHYTTKMRFTAKNPGVTSNGIEIAIAHERDFDTGKAYAFEGVALNDLFETKPYEDKQEIGVVVREEGKITGSYVVSLDPEAKDYRNKSSFIEDVINKYNESVYVKLNSTVSDRAVQSRLAEDGDDNIDTNKPMKTVRGFDGVIGANDILEAYGSVAENTIFGNKDELDVDIVIGNEMNRIAAAKLATERADCIAFLGARFEDVVGLKSVKIVENLVADVMTGELNNALSATSFVTVYGNYKKQYDKFNDKMRWVSLAGDIAGLRADVNSKDDSWFASAGIENGQIKNAQKLAFNPNQGQRDLLYKNKINPVISLPGQGNAIVWGQKTLQAKASSFDRINVRGLFNTIERAIEKMSKNYVFKQNDSFTRNRFVATIKPYLDRVKAGRGIYDFYIRCDLDNNTPAIIDANEFVADIAIKPTRTAEFLTLNFLSVGTGVSFQEVFV